MVCSMIDVKNLAPTAIKYLDALHKSEHKIITWIAPVRQGKTAAMCIGLVERAAYNYAAGIGNHQYILGGATHESVRRNTLTYMEDICENYGIPFAYKESSYYDLGGFAKVFLFGGDNARSFQKVRGSTIESAFLDEATLLHKDFIETVLDRISYDDGVLTLASNADSPSHWIKTELIDKDVPETLILEGTWGENFHFPEERARWRFLFNPDSHLYQRNVLNRWVAPSGLVFPIRPEYLVEKDLGYRGVVAVDVGYSSGHAALLFVPDSGGRWHIADEEYHDAKRHGIRTEQWHMEKYLAKWQPRYFVVDKSAASFKETVRQNGHVPYNSDSRVETGIQHVLDSLHSGRLTIDPRHCPKLLEQCLAYAWNEVTEKPIKENDHLPDAMRYGTMKVLPPMTMRMI